MRKLNIPLAVLAIVSMACGTSSVDDGSSTASTTTSTAGAAAAVGPDLELLRSMYEGTSGESLLEGLTVEVTDTTVQLNTRLFRDKEAAPQAIGLCIAAQDAGASGEIEVYASDGGLMATTRFNDGTCRLVPSLAS